jgi:hypothetical protein
MLDQFAPILAGGLGIITLLGLIWVDTIGRETHRRSEIFRAVFMVCLGLVGLALLGPHP